MKLATVGFLLLFNRRLHLICLPIGCRDFTDYLHSGTVSKSLFIKQLANAVKVASHNAEWREEYEMLIMQEQYLLNQGRQEGRQEERIQSVITALKTLNPEAVSKVLEIPLEEVLQIKKMSIQK